ncbi:hypothetical protein ACS0TY_008720 [Phlomoides rotata]
MDESGGVKIWGGMGKGVTFIYTPTLLCSFTRPINRGDDDTHSFYFSAAVIVIRGLYFFLIGGAWRDPLPPARVHDLLDYELDGIDWKKVDFEDNQESLNLFEKNTSPRPRRDGVVPPLDKERASHLEDFKLIKFRMSTCNLYNKNFLDGFDAQGAVNDLTGKWLGSRQIRCNWATKGVSTSDGKQGSDSKSVVELINGSSENVKEAANSDVPENNPQYTTVYVGNLAPEIDLHRHFHALGAGSIEEVRVQRDKGFGFVRYSTHAETAMDIQLGNTQSYLCGKPIKALVFSSASAHSNISNPLQPPTPAPLHGLSTADILAYERQIAMSKMGAAGIHPLLHYQGQQHHLKNELSGVSFDERQIFVYVVSCLLVYEDVGNVEAADAGFGHVVANAVRLLTAGSPATFHLSIANFTAVRDVLGEIPGPVLLQLEVDLTSRDLEIK